jgi:hypothetical protein
MEKTPARRYATAADFADDLDALVERRRVVARPPGPGARLARWARRRPARAAVVGSLLAVALVGGGVAFWRAREAAAERRAEAERLVSAALADVDRYRKARVARVQEDERLSLMHRDRESVYSTDEVEREYHRLASRLAGRRRDDERLFHGVLETLDRAERLDAGVERADEVRARLYLERMEEAQGFQDADAAAFYESLVERHDPEGRVIGPLRAVARVGFVSEPAGAEVYLHRHVDLSRLEEGSERRLVPVPARGPMPWKADAWALRVVRGAGALRAGDLVLELDGRAIGRGLFVLEDRAPALRGDRVSSVEGRPAVSAADVREAAGEREGDLAWRLERGDGVAVLVRAPASALVVGDAAALAAGGGLVARTFRGDALRTEMLPAGLGLRTTASPRFLTSACRLGTTPIDPMELPPGSYAVSFRAPGHEDVVVAILLQGRTARTVTARLLPAGTTPEGFVRVVHAGDSAADYWIQEHEVTCDEYAEYLADPDTQAEIRAAAAPIRFPRSGQDAHEGGGWERPKRGGFAIPAHFGPDFPVLGVSWEDATAYARWRSRRDGRSYALPTLLQHVTAGGALAGRTYPFGDAFSPRWAKSCYSRPKAFPEGVMQYPVDESPYGAYDLSGSAREWLDGWYDESRGLRRSAGGAWGDAASSLFKLYGGEGYGPTVTGYQLGFRLVLPADERR